MNFDAGTPEGAHRRRHGMIDKDWLKGSMMCPVPASEDDGVAAPALFTESTVLSGLQATKDILVQHESQPAIDILVRAFHDDPVMNWMSSHPDFRRTFFSITLPVFLPDGLTYIDAQQRGAAAWLAPNHKLRWPVTPGNLWRMFRVCGPGGFLRFGRSGFATAKFHPDEPHYYLFLLGALPEHQGQGVGSALMQPVLRRCDEDHLPAYLENSKRENLAFYRGHGFKVVEQIRFARSAPPVWLMWRKPRRLR